MGESIHDVKNDDEYDDFAMEEDSQRYLKSFLTKQMCKILIILFSQTLSNKELAEKMGISASALSNILLRMKASKIELFNTEKVDKFILYSLTAVARAYVKNNLITTEDSEAKVIRFNDDETENYLECSDALNKLKHTLQINSEKEFYRFMIDNYVKEDGEKKSVLDSFINHFQKMDDEKHTEVSRKMIEEIGDPLLEKNILHCLSLYKAMINLCNIFWELAYKGILSLFESQGTGFGLEFIEECKDLNGGEIAEMGRCLWEIVSISEKSHLSMKEFVECWSAFFSDKQFLYFFALRYDSWRIEREKSARQNVMIN